MSLNGHASKSHSLSWLLDMYSGTQDFHSHFYLYLLPFQIVSLMFHKCQLILKWLMGVI